MKHCKIKIIQPIVLHDKEEVNIDELKQELILCKELGATGIYVYRQGIDYPYGRTGDYTWHKIEKVLNHIEEYRELKHKNTAVIEWNPNRGFRLD